MFLTIFTPIYNRAYCISRLYESLCRQTCKDFEWLVVDDGSTDDICELINGYINDGILDIKFYRQENAGKHIAINRGVEVAQGKYFYIVDSDDYIPDDAVDFIYRNTMDIDCISDIAGIVGIDKTTDDRILSNLPKMDYIDATSLEIRYKYHIEGDMAEVIKTDIMQKYPFPMVKGEKYSAESVVWNRIANNGYKLRYFPTVIKIIEYLPDGLSASIIRMRMKSPVIATMCYSELIKMDIPIKQKVKTAINYWRFWFCRSEYQKSKIGFLWFWAFPLGYLMHLVDSRK